MFSKCIKEDVFNKEEQRDDGDDCWLVDGVLSVMAKRSVRYRRERKGERESENL